MRASSGLGLTLVSAAAFAAAGCGGHEGGGELRAEKKMLEREVQGLREISALLERGEPVIPASDVAVALDESLLRDLLSAQLPFEAEVDRYRVTLTGAEASFRGSPQVRLRGTLALRDNPELAGDVSVLGGLEGIKVDEATGTLKASVGVDHLDIEKAAGLEKFLSGSTLDELARTIRLQITGRLPTLSIPVKVQERIELPAVAEGPVTIDGASMPLQAGISRVLAGQGRLWIGISFRPGDVVKTSDAPPAALGSAEEQKRP